MRSPLETLEGAFEHAIFTTYSVNLHFFERFVLPMLRRAGVRNVLIFADRVQLGSALTPRGVTFLGRSYQAVSVSLGPGVFHPKLIYLRGESKTRACISSANLTEDGQLRNVEAAIVLDDSLSQHLQAVADLEEFIRRLAGTAPTPAAEAVLSALPANRDVPPEPSPLRVLHNLERPLIDAFPGEGDLVAVTPFVDSGPGASALAERGALHVVTDGARFAAPSSFFQGSWTVAGYDFGERRLHGKAYWGTAQGWLLLGSPNLSAQALLRTASSGNTEVGVLVSPTAQALDIPSSLPWVGDPLEVAAPVRHLRPQPEQHEASVSSFNAWEDDDVIRVDLRDGVELEFWHDDQWFPLGRVHEGAVARPPDAHPYLIRTASEPFKQAVVHRPGALRRHRLGSQRQSRGADVVTRLPIDLEGVKALEGVLTDLYALSALSNERVAELKGLHESGGRESDEETLTEWTPAHPDDEPRIPELYRKAWKNAPDALLALIRGALRLDYQDEIYDERELMEELVELDELDDEPPVDAPPPSPVPPIGSEVLKRYRSSLMKLLGRGTEFLQHCEDAALAEFGFQVLLKLHERLGALSVEVDGNETALIERPELLHQKLELLSSYLRARGGRDPQCLATARIHLAECVATKIVWTPMEWEQLAALAHATAADILAGDDGMARRAAEDASVSFDEATARLKPFADRAGWHGYRKYARQLLDGVEFGVTPFPWVTGSDWFVSLDLSPVWRLAGYGAIAGFRDASRYGVVAENNIPTSSYRFHALLVDPGHQRVVEAALRRADGRWIVRDYRPVWASRADNLLRIGEHALADCERSQFRDYDASELDGALGELVSVAIGVKT